MKTSRAPFSRLVFPVAVAALASACATAGAQTPSLSLSADAVTDLPGALPVLTGLALIGFGAYFRKR